MNIAIQGDDGGNGNIKSLAVAVASLSTPAKTVNKLLGIFSFCNDANTPGLAFAAAHPAALKIEIDKAGQVVYDGAGAGGAVYATLMYPVPPKATGIAWHAPIVSAVLGNAGSIAPVQVVAGT